MFYQREKLLKNVRAEMAGKAGPLLKVLVIHGYRQNAKSSREKTGSFRKGLRKYLDLVYITAPNRILSDIGNQNKEYGWWFSKKNNDDIPSFSAHEASSLEIGHAESIELVKKTFQEEGPFDGIVAFSQGATFAAHLCALREEGDEILKFKFAIICAGFKSRSCAHARYYEKMITCPSLHVYGDTDQIIQKEMSVELKEVFQNPTVLNHAGGHHLPATSADRKVYQDFLERFQTTSIT